MEVVIISSVIVSLLVIISTTAIIIQKRSITNDYNNKMNNLVSQINDAQKTVYTYAGNQDKVIDKHDKSIYSISSNVTTLQKQSEINNNNIITLELQSKSYNKKNDTNITNIQRSISQMPWQEQLLNTANLQVGQEEHQIEIDHLKYTDAIQGDRNAEFSVDIYNNSNNIFLLSNLVKANHNYSTTNINTLNQNLSRLSNATTVSFSNTSNLHYGLSNIAHQNFYSIQGNYVILSNAYVGFSNLASEKIININQNILNLSNNYMPKTTFTSYSNNTGLTISAINSTLADTRASYATLSNLNEAVLAKSASLQESLGLVITNRVNSVDNRVTITNSNLTSLQGSLPDTYANKTVQNTSNLALAGNITTLQNKTSMMNFESILPFTTKFTSNVDVTGNLNAKTIKQDDKQVATLEHVTQQISTRATPQDVASAVRGLATTTDVDQKVSTRATQDYVNQQISKINIPAQIAQNYNDVTLTGRTNLTGDVDLNRKRIRLRDPGDNNHSLAYNSDIDGPELTGWKGGALGTTEGRANKVLQWNKDGTVQINGNIKVCDDKGEDCIDVINYEPEYTVSINEHKKWWEGQSIELKLPSKVLSKTYDSSSSRIIREASSIFIPRGVIVTLTNNQGETKKLDHRDNQSHVGDNFDNNVKTVKITRAISILGI